jgi:sugar lactone lactonase YvrE
MKQTKYPLLLPAAVLVLLCLSSLQGFAQGIMINTVAGYPSAGFSGDGGLATAAQFNTPSGMAIDNAGTLYVADELNNRIRKIYAGGIITTIAGSGPVGIGAYGGDGGSALSARLNAPLGIAVDTFGNIYIADNQNFRIRKMNTAGIISTIGGTGVSGYTGDGGPATNAKISYVQSLTIDVYGNLFFADVGNHVVRKMTPAGIISTVAGIGMSGFSGDGGAATLAKLNTPRGVKADAAGNLYIADLGNARVRKVDVSGVISTFAGGGSGGPGGPATAADIAGVSDIAIDPAGNVIIVRTNGRVMIVDGVGTIHALAGAGIDGFSGDGCAATAAEMYTPRYGICDPAGNLYVSEADNYVIRKISVNHPPSFAGGHLQSFSMCKDTLADINDILSIVDSDQAQSVEWSVYNAPANGAATIAYTGTTTGGISVPSALWYTPDSGFVGTDNFSVIVKDCLGLRDTTYLTVTVINCTLGTPIQKARPNAGLQVFPNPGHGEVSIIAAGKPDERVNLTITNMLGVRVWEQTTQANSAVSVSAGLTPGCYMVSARVGGANYYSKLVIE